MHLTKLASGNGWRVAVKHHGERRSGSAPTRAQAQRLGAELLLQLGGSPSARPTVDELLDAHLADVELSPTTRADYLAVAEHLPVTFRTRRVLEVTPVVVEGLHRELERAGLSTHRIGRIHALLSVAWQRAVRYEWAERNPFRHVAPRRAAGAEIVPPTPDQVAALIAAAPAGFGDYLRLAASTGARRGELVALQWVDVRLEASELSIRRSFAYTPASGVVERPTKTGAKGQRVIAVGLPVATALRRLHTAQAAAAVEAGLGAPVWVFSRCAGAEPWHPDYPTTAFARARDAAGIIGVRLHDLRHFVATQMLGAGHSVAQVAARLGQTQLATTQRYSHWIPSRDREAADALKAIVGG